MSQEQTFIFSIFLFSIVYGIIHNCPSTQELHTHFICQLLKNTNIDEIFTTSNFTENNYCIWNFTNPQIYINCTENNEILDIVIEEVDINGTLDLRYPWPSTIKQIDFEQTYVHSTNLFGEWNWTSFINLNNLYELDISRNQISGTISSVEFDMFASNTSLKNLLLSRNLFQINFTNIILDSYFPYLEFFEFNSNRAYGKLDTSTTGFFSYFPNLIGFYIAGQVYTGNGKLHGHFDNFDCISIINLPNLQYFDIAWNNFSGSLKLSPNHSLNSNLKIFEMDHNIFSGSINWNIFSGLYNLYELDLNYNQFTGNINWNILADLVMNGSLRAIELDHNNFEGYVDFSWIPNNIHSLVIKIDLNISCDPIIYPCSTLYSPLNRSFSECHNKTHCESSCQCLTQLPSNIPTIPPLILTLSPTSHTNNSSICGNEFDVYIESTYQTALEYGLCIEGALFLDVISQLIEIIDIVYKHNNFMVYTTVQNEEFNKYFGVQQVCGNVSINMVTCFNKTINETELVKLSKSKDFKDEINNEIGIVNDSIIYITDIIIIYSYQPTTSP
eukprot:503603_1